MKPLSNRELLDAYVVHNAVKLCVCVHCENYRHMLRSKEVIE